MATWKEKRSCVNSSSSSKTSLLISWESQHLHLHCPPPFHNGTSVHYMYCLVRKQLRKINVMREYFKIPFCGYIICFVSKGQLRNINVIRVLQRASVYEYMIWVFLIQLSHILKFIWTHCTVYWTAYNKWLSSHTPHHH